ncbi:hypothetical protein [Liquorilactobacillus nagelii]|uniref:hypothetical protein n=1 Tax=Liquorilactobacillus nagelii TaxID=82688 RepID=UPI0006F19290|nr:hypothetical protein [Liquorilactobacillus nagelii]KRL40755.1 hypothetical protein FD45_GL001400 [Liquorilactobacillus nagelii DSM 13675]QYH53719.1 hypothetical protein G6O73_02985 [Liquorilactobacillus nagelii DSM 13675]
MDEIDQFVPMLSHLLQKAMGHARNAKRTLFLTGNETYKYEAASSYATLAYSDFQSFWLISKTHETLDRYEFDDLMPQVTTFCDEILENLATNHSQQWSDIEYKRLVQTVYPVQQLLNTDALTDEEIATLN